MNEKGILRIKKSQRGFYGQIEIKGITMSVPPFYEIKDDSLNNKECEVEREGGQIKRIAVDGQELARKNQPHIDSKGNFQAYHHEKDKTWTDRKQNDSLKNIWSIDNAKIPNDTKELLKNFREDEFENYSLKLNKFAQFIDSDKKFEFYKTDKGNPLLNIKPDYHRECYQKYLKNIELRQNRMITILSKIYEKRSASLKVDWRLVVGLGGGSVYETSMTLHHIYGIPYLPGSAVKGVARSFIITEHFGKPGRDGALKDKNFCDVFGCPKESFYKEDRKGKVIFMDAFPSGIPNIKPDIMNPHYGDYYSGNAPPADYLSPNPIFFLTVEDTPFCFYLLAKKKDSEILDKTINGRTILEWLEEALREHGIGAKTSVGYGYFSNPS